MMMIDEKITALCVKSIDYKESDKLLTLCSVEHGLCLATAKGVKKVNAKLKYAAQPFNFGEYTLVGKNGRYIVADCKQIESFSEISYDIKAYYAGFAILKVLSLFCAENVSCPRIVLYAIKALKAITMDKMMPQKAYNKFIYHALDELGFKLDFTHCLSCGKELNEAYFSKEDGIVCSNCGNMFKNKIPHDVFLNFKNNLDSNDEFVQKNTNLFLEKATNEMLGVKITILD